MLRAAVHFDTIGSPSKLWHSGVFEPLIEIVANDGLPTTRETRVRAGAKARSGPTATQGPELAIFHSLRGTRDTVLI